MRMPKLSIAALMGLVLITAIGFAALSHPTRLWAAVLFSAVSTILTVAVLAGLFTRGPRRAFWAGFAIGGWMSYAPRSNCAIWRSVRGRRSIAARRSAGPALSDGQPKAARVFGAAVHPCKRRLRPSDRGSCPYVRLSNPASSSDILDILDRGRTECAPADLLSQPPYPCLLS
jgi:hypothetical protein